MFSLRSVTSLVAGTALVAGLSLAGAAPAQSSGEVTPATGTTAISLDIGVVEALTGVGVAISVRNPASFNASKLAARFPVTGINEVNGAILHSGALVFARGSVENGTVVLGQPTLRPQEGHPIFRVTAKTVLGGENAGRLDVMRVTNVRVRERADGAIIATGIVRLSADPAIANALNTTLGLTGVFEAGMTLGTARAVIIPS